MAEIHPIERRIRSRTFIVPVHWVMQMVLSGTVPTNKLRQTLDLYCLIRIKGQVILSVIAGWEWLYAGEGREDGARRGGGWLEWLMFAPGNRILFYSYIVPSPHHSDS